MLDLFGDDDSSDEDVQFLSQSTKVNVPEVITIVDSDEEEQIPVVEAPIPSTSNQRAARPAARAGAAGQATGDAGAAAGVARI